MFLLKTSVETLSVLSYLQLKSILFVFLTITLSLPWTTWADVEQLEIDHRQEMTMGRGYDYRNDKVKETCLDTGNAIERYPRTGFDRLRGELTILETTRELHTQLKTSVTTKAKILTVGADSTFNWDFTNDMNSYTSNGFVAIVGKTSSIVLNGNEKIKAELVELAKNNFDEFTRRCGTHFITEQIRGGRIAAGVIEKTDSMNTIVDTKANLNASYLAFKANSELSNNLKRFVKSRELKITGDVQGGSAGLPSSFKKLPEVLSTFGPSVVNAPASLYVKIKSYRHLIDLDRDDLFLEPNVQVMNALVDRAFEYDDLLKDIAYIEDNPEQFYWLPEHSKNFYDLQAWISEEKDQLVDKLRECQKSSNCEFPDWFYEENYSPEFYRENLPRRFEGFCNGGPITLIQPKHNAQNPATGINYNDVINAPWHIKGDKDFHGQADLYLEIRLIPDGKKLWKEVDLWAKEGRHDWTEFQRREPIHSLAYDLGSPPYSEFGEYPDNDYSDCIFYTGEEYNKTFTLETRFEGSGHKTVNGTEIIKSAICKADDDGNDDDDVWCQNIIFNPWKGFDMFHIEELVTEEGGIGAIRLTEESLHAEHEEFLQN